jgi:hypothetical protein
MKYLVFPSSGLPISQACIQVTTCTLVAVHWNTGLLLPVHCYLCTGSAFLGVDPKKMKYKVPVSLWLVEKSHSFDIDEMLFCQLIQEFHL